MVATWALDSGFLEALEGRAKGCAGASCSWPQFMKHLLFLDPELRALYSFQLCLPMTQT